MPVPGFAEETLGVGRWLFDFRPLAPRLTFACPRFFVLELGGLDPWLVMVWWVWRNYNVIEVQIAILQYGGSKVREDGC